jgi:chemotaxis methyl-accepting protein methylase
VGARFSVQRRTSVRRLSAEADSSTLKRAPREVLKLAFTFFFRDQQVLERVAEHLLPSLAGRAHPRIWDAGSAMGQEPYTLAMILAERMGHFAFNNLRIDATDVESTGQFAQMIEAALYPRTKLSRLPRASWRSTSNRMANMTTFV